MLGASRRTTTRTHQTSPIQNGVLSGLAGYPSPRFGTFNVEKPMPVLRKGLLSSTAYSILSNAEKKESHRLEFEHRPEVVFAATDYLYHATSTAALLAIRLSGLTTRDARGLAAQDPSKDAFISAAKTVVGAGSLSSSSTLLRFKPRLSPGPWKAYGAAAEVRTMSAVPANILEKKSGATWVAV